MVAVEGHSDRAPFMPGGRNRRSRKPRYFQPELTRRRGQVAARELANDNEDPPGGNLLT